MKAPGFIPVTPHIHLLKLPLFGAMVAVWLVRDGDDWSLIDTGPSGQAETVRRAVEGLVGSAPQRIVCTHGHFDHVGALPVLAATWRVPVFAHRAEIPFIAGPARHRDLRPASMVYRALSLICSPPAPCVPVEHSLEENDRIAGMRVIHVPGHTPGMIALLHEEDRALMAADAFRFKLFGAMPLYTWDRAAARESMRKLADLDFDCLLTSHNDPIFKNGRIAARGAANAPLYLGL